MIYRPHCRLIREILGNSVSRNPYTYIYTMCIVQNNRAVEPHFDMEWFE